MNNNGYYAGHSFSWMQKFLQTIPKKKGLSKTYGYAIASCIHHQCIYSKQQVFKLNHRLLKKFGISRKSISTYLFLFREAELIDYQIKQGSLPVINLLELPHSIYKINKGNIKIYNSKGTGVQTRTGDMSKQTQAYVQTRTGDMSKQGHVGKPDLRRGRVPGKGSKEGRVSRNEGKQGILAREALF